MNPELSRIAILCISVILTIAFVGATIVSGVVARQRPEESTQALLGLVEGGNSIRLLSTLAVVVVATFLALAGSLTEGTIALLSSVAGFMLGGVKREAGEVPARRAT